MSKREYIRRLLYLISIRRLRWSISLIKCPPRCQLKKIRHHISMAQIGYYYRPVGHFPIPRKVRLKQVTFYLVFAVFVFWAFKVSDSRPA